MALILLKEHTPRASLLRDICSAHTSLTPKIFKHDVKGENLMVVWFKDGAIPTKEQCGKIYEDLRYAEGVEVAICDHYMDGFSVAWNVFFK